MTKVDVVLEKFENVTHVAFEVPGHEGPDRFAELNIRAGKVEMVVSNPYDGLVYRLKFPFAERL